MADIETITIGTATFSVYGLGNADPVADADDYLSAKIGSTWSAATTLEKQQAIVTAARLLDRSLLWSGTRTVATQDLEWPRDGATNGCTATAVADGTTPDDIAYGEFELAQLLYTDNTIADSAGTGSNTKKVKAGSASVEFFMPTIGSTDETRLPTAVQDIVGCFIDGTSGILPSSGSLSSGTGDDSAFDDDCDPDWDRTGAF